MVNIASSFQRQRLVSSLVRISCACAARIAALPQERKLAVAEAPKALLPFGAGCTAIFAAACATFSESDDLEKRQLDLHMLDYTARETCENRRTRKANTPIQAPCYPAETNMSYESYVNVLTNLFLSSH